MFSLFSTRNKKATVSRPFHENKEPFNKKVNFFPLYPKRTIPFVLLQSAMEQSTNLSLDSELALREVRVALLGLLQHAGLVLR